MITLDVMMPDLDGWTVLSALKDDPALASIPVVMLTMLDDQGIAPEEVLLLRPDKEGTVVEAVAEMKEVRDLLNSGHTVADAVLPHTAPRRTSQLRLFE